MTAAQRAAVKALLVALMPDSVVHGGCVGADEDFHYLVREFRIPTDIFWSNLVRKYADIPLDHARVNFAPMPPLTRNKIMAALCDILIATPREDTEVLRSGTWATIRRARKFHRRIYIIYPDGKLKEELP